MFVRKNGLSNRSAHEIKHACAVGLDQRRKNSEEMMSMSNKNTIYSAHQATAGAQKTTNVALADFPGATITLPKTRAHVAVKNVAERTGQVCPKFLGMKADDIRRFTFV